MQKTLQGNFATTTKTKLAINVKMVTRNEFGDVDVTIRSKTTKE
jgi:hypothetical protein